MRKFTTTLGVGLTALALLLASGPARAAGAEFVDPAGDATGLSAVESSPRPSEPELDLLGVTYASDGKTFTVSAKVTKLADPVASGGSAFRWAWIYDGITYELVFQVPISPTDAAFVRGGVFRGNGATITINCCKTKYDAKSNTIGLTLDVASIAKGVKSTSADSPKFGPGSKIESLKTTSQRSMGAVLLSADIAIPKAGTTLTI